jgi:hypothetical protein
MVCKLIKHTMHSCMLLWFIVIKSTILLKNPEVPKYSLTIFIWGKKVHRIGVKSEPLLICANKNPPMQNLGMNKIDEFNAEVRAADSNNNLVVPQGQLHTLFYSWSIFAPSHSLCIKILLLCHFCSQIVSALSDWLICDV